VTVSHPTPRPTGHRECPPEEPTTVTFDPTAHLTEEQKTWRVVPLGRLVTPANRPATGVRLEVALRPPPGADPDQVRRHAERLAEAIRDGIPELALTYDADRPRPVGETVLLTLVPANPMAAERLLPQIIEVVWREAPALGGLVPLRVAYTWSGPTEVRELPTP
jgi:hypothetical protein